MKLHFCIDKKSSCQIPILFGWDHNSTHSTFLLVIQRQTKQRQQEKLILYFKAGIGHRKNWLLIFFHCNSKNSTYFWFKFLYSKPAAPNPFWQLYKFTWLRLWLYQLVPCCFLFNCAWSNPQLILGLFGVSQSLAFGAHQALLWSELGTVKWVVYICICKALQ